MEAKVYLLPFDKEMCLASCTWYLLVWLEKNYPGRYNQKDLLIRIIALPAVITLLGEGKKIQAIQTWWKITVGKVTAQSRKGYMAISKQSEAHYSTDRKVIQTWKKMLFSIFSGGNIPMHSPWGETVHCSARTRISYGLKVESWRCNYITPRVLLQWLRNPLPCRRICNDLS